MQGHAHAPQGAPFRLRQRAIGVDDAARVDHHEQLFDFHHASAAVHFHSGNARRPRRHIAFLAERGGNAQARVGRHGRAPAGLVRHAPQHVGQAHGAADGVRRAARIAPRRLQQRQTERQRIDLGRLRRLVHETFHSPIRPAGPHGAQPAGAETAVGQVVRHGPHALRAHRIPVVGAGDGERIIRMALLILGQEGGDHDLRGPARAGLVHHRRHLAGAIERHAHVLHGWRTGRIETGVVGPRAYHLDGPPHGLRGQRGRHAIIAIQAPPETATEQIGMQHDMALGHLQRLRQHGQYQRLPLIARMNVPDAVDFLRQGIHGFQLEMQYGAGRVVAFQLQAGIVERLLHAIIIDHARPQARIGQLLAGVVDNILLRHVGRRAGPPFHLHQLGRAHGGRIRFGHHHDPAGHRAAGILQGERTQITLHLFRGRIIDGHHFRAVAGRRDLRARKQHALDFRIDAVHGRTIDFRGDVERLHVLADQAALLRRFQHDGFQLLGRVLARQLATAHDVAIADRAPPAMHDAQPRVTGGHGHAQQARAFLDQRKAPGRAGTAERIEILPDGPAAARHHQAPFRVRVHVMQAHLAPVRFKLLGHDARQGRADVLAHFRLGDVDGNDAVAADLEPDAGIEHGHGALLRLHRCHLAGGQGAVGAQEGERKPRAGGGDQETAPSQRAGAGS
ncbi:hypothetical protein D3C71_421270 [compost metagenome]